MPMEPPTTTHQQKKVGVIKGRPIFYEPPELKLARSKLMGSLGQYVPDVPFAGPVQLVVKWCFPLIKGKTDGQYKDTKPDTDNLNKLLKDCMQELKFFRDDSQVASEIIEKFWAETPGIFVQVDELTNKEFYGVELP